MDQPGEPESVLGYTKLWSDLIDWSIPHKWGGLWMFDSACMCVCTCVLSDVELVDDT